MGIRKYKPVTPGRRDATVSDFAELTPGARPEKSLLRPIVKTGGRNNQGKLSGQLLFELAVSIIAVLIRNITSSRRAFCFYYPVYCMFLVQ